MKNNVSLIVAREYMSRVRRRSFIISTILMPVIMIGLMAMPTIVAMMSGPEKKTIAVVDDTHFIGNALVDAEGMSFVRPDQPVDSLKKNADLDMILVIPANVVDDPTGVTLYTNGAPAPQTEIFLTTLLNNVIEQVRLSRYDIPDLQKIIQDVKVDVQLHTVRIDGESEETASSLVSSLMGMLMSLILYMFIMLYGQMVMTSIIEEKNNRVLEIVVSSVKPTGIMLGKILGIGAVAVTQMLIWAALIGGFTTFVMPQLVTDALASGGDAGLLDIIATLGAPGYIMGVFGLMTLFLVFGYMMYSAIYAAIGSAVDNIQDASQLQSFAIVPIILGMVFAMTVINDPNSDMALWLSYIPFTSPMVMMARIPFGIPAIQIVISLAILVFCTVFMVWMSAKIYRVGIFMYGKKPTFGELIRWARYK